MLFLLFAIACFAAGAFFLGTLCMTLIFGVILLCTKRDHPAYEDRKWAVRSLLIALLIGFCVFACCLALFLVLGSQVTFSM